MNYCLYRAYLYSLIYNSVFSCKQQTLTKQKRNLLKDMCSQNTWVSQQIRLGDHCSLRPLQFTPLLVTPPAALCSYCRCLCCRRLCCRALFMLQGKLHVSLPSLLEIVLWEALSFPDALLNYSYPFDVPEKLGLGYTGVLAAREAERVTF